MKSIYKIFLLALGVYTSAFSQITEITRLPVQDISQSIKDYIKNIGGRNENINSKERSCLPILPDFPD
jgi:ABC-type amino acid transport system permease subunit